MLKILVLTQLLFNTTLRITLYFTPVWQSMLSRKCHPPCFYATSEFCARCCWAILIMTEIKPFLIWLNTQYLGRNAQCLFLSFLFYLCQGLRSDLSVHIGIFNLEICPPYALIVPLFQCLPSCWKLCFCTCPQVSYSIVRYTDHDFKSVFMGIRVLLTPSAVLKGMNLAVVLECYWLAL